MYESDSNRLPATTQTPLGRRGSVSRVFLNDQGLRSGWRLLLYILSVVFLVWCSQFVLRKFLGHGVGGETSGRLIITETVLLIAAMLPAVVASRLEGRSWRTYGLPIRPEGSRFAVGLVLGFAALSLLMLLIYGFHGVYLGNAVLHGAAVARYAIVWGIAFLLVGIVEEFLFRGYSLYTLATGIGFWPAGVLLCSLFGGLHLLNGGEDWLGGLATAINAMVFVFSLWRTGSLWFAVGLHASWDWGESFFYGVPDSGQKAVGTLFDSHFAGSKWITGGSVGPEGSLLVFVVIAAMFLAIHLLYPRRQWKLE
jgi:membrane protease YdiL (CAAX protease family)